MVTISGVRGVVGESLTPEVIVKYISAFAQVIDGKKIVVGSDSRVSGPFVKSIVLGTLVAKGYNVVDLGVVPTPTVQIMTEKLEADAGLVITASHNPVEWNGLKFIDSDGLFLSPEKCEQMFALADSSFSNSDWKNLGEISTYADANADHINIIKELDYVNVDHIKQKKFRVALDTINGAGCSIMGKLLEELGCEVHQINGEATGVFNHTPEPVPQNLGQLAEHVVKTNADLGIAVDPDVDRCVFINEHGKPIGEEYTLAIVTKFILDKKLGMVVKNMSTTMALNDIASYYNCQVYEAAVGEINVANKMKEMNAVIGGEGNGGVMLPDVHIGRDAPIAAALVLAALSEFGGSLSELKASLPQYEIVKKKISIEGKNPDAVIASLTKKFSDKKTSDIDGLKIYGKNWWVHLRKSNTEPIMRVIAEAPSEAEAEQICNEYMEMITEAAV